jgi:DME family drug/metabolite transporter
VRFIMTAEVEISRPALRPDTELMRGILPILVCSVLWGTVGLASVYAPAAASPESVGAGGLLIVGALMLIARPGARTLLRHARGHDRVLLIIGSFGLLVYPLAFFPAVRDLGVSLATAITLGSAPLFAGLIARFVERRRLTRRWLQCAPIAVAGTALLVAGDAGARSVSIVGVILALIPGLAYATVSTVAARLIGQGKESNDVYGAMFGMCAVWSVAASPRSGRSSARRSASPCACAAAGVPTSSTAASSMSTPTRPSCPRPSRASAGTWDPA